MPAPHHWRCHCTQTHTFSKYGGREQSTPEYIRPVMNAKTTESQSSTPAFASTFWPSLIGYIIAILHSIFTHTHGSFADAANAQKPRTFSSILREWQVKREREGDRLLS